MIRLLWCGFAGACAPIGYPTVDLDWSQENPNPLQFHGAASLWLLIHPTDAPSRGPGIVEVDEDGVELSRLPLPPDATSPHGLAWDGSMLWMSDLGTDGLYALDPDTGAVISFLPGISTQGVAVDGDGLWVAGDGVYRVDHTGLRTDERPSPPVVQDVAYDGVAVITLTNGATDYATRISPTGEQTKLREPVTEGNTGSAMTAWHSELVLVDQLWDEQDHEYDTVLRHVNPFTGALLSYEPLPVEGEITALAFRP